MPADPSIYGNVQAPQINIPNPLDLAQKSMQLSQLGMQQMQMARQLQSQSAMQSAMLHNTDPTTGQLDQGGYLSDLGKMNPMAAQQETSRLAQQNEATAKAQALKLDNAEKAFGIVYPNFKYLMTRVPEEQRPDVYPQLIQQMKSQGVDTSQLPDHYDAGVVGQQWQTMQDHHPILENQLTQAKTAQAQAEAAKTRSETPNGNVGQITADTDPATLVPQMLPKDMRPKALEEIKNAQDITALTPKIVAAFQMGTSKNPITAKQGQMQFEGLINTTVKDTEGTVRQAAMDSIHKTMTPSGLTALPGENEAKLNTVLSYLQSKKAAPINKSGGIDLSKFNSTAPYQPSSKDSGNNETAQAAPPGTIRMSDGKRTKFIPVGMKGDAIADGFSVVK
jgi:hypothetical protein